MLCHVDDLLVCGDPDLAKELTDKLAKGVLLKIEGELKAGTTVNFLGRTLKHNGDSVDIIMSTKVCRRLAGCVQHEKLKTGHNDWYSDRAQNCERD